MVEFDLVAHLARQRRFSLRTFGPSPRAAGIVAHIREELDEITAEPTDLAEWIDVVILAFDGAWRAGHSPEEIAAALAAKQMKNEARVWPDWRQFGADESINHDRAHDVAPPAPVCHRCDGCGQIANDDDGTPWTMWANLPPGSDLAVRMGMVYPISCPDCSEDGANNQVPSVPERYENAALASLLQPGMAAYVPRHLKAQAARTLDERGIAHAPEGGANNG